MEWSWPAAASAAPKIAAGLGVTLMATLLASLVALGMGLVLALLARSRLRGVAALTRGLVDFIRCTPLIVQLYLLFYLLPDLGLYLSPLAAGVTGLGLHYAAYLSEVYRAGIDNVPRSQLEAAHAINLTRWQTMRYVILPQAIPPMLPSIGNYVLAMFKETPLLSVITLVEIMLIARGISTTTYRYLEPITIVGFYFLLLSLPCAWAIRRLERLIARG